MGLQKWDLKKLAILCQINRTCYVWLNMYDFDIIRNRHEFVKQKSQEVGKKHRIIQD